MIQKREFSNIHKQIVLSNQKHKCKKCGIKFNVAHLPNFGYTDGVQKKERRYELHLSEMQISMAW
jgi:transposase-like protein